MKSIIWLTFYYVLFVTSKTVCHVASIKPEVPKSAQTNSDQQKTSTTSENQHSNPAQRSDGINLGDLINIFNTNAINFDQLETVVVKGLINTILNNENLRTVLLLRLAELLSPATGTAFLSSLNLTTSCLESWAFLGKAMMTTEYGGPLRDWTITFWDSMGKIPAGIRNGHLNWLGDFSACINIEKWMDEHSHTGPPDFQGEYCLVYVVPVSDQGLPISSIFPKIGVCFPSTCTHDDKEKLLHILTWLPKVAIAIPEQFCQVKDGKPWDAYTLVAGFIVGTLAILVISGTVYEICLLLRTNHSPKVEKSQNGLVDPVLLAFSAYKNTKKIFHVDDNSQDLSALHGIRCLTIIWIVIAHILAMTCQNYIWRNQAEVLNFSSVATKYVFKVFLAAAFSSDTFILMTGFLTTYIILNQRRLLRGKFTVFAFYFHRLWRLTPPYVVVIAIMTGLMNHLGSGPVWPLMQEDIGRCQKSWWKNILYIQNLADNFYDQCLLPSWYMAIDVQMCLVAPLFIFPFISYPKWGLMLTTTALLITTLVPGILTYIYDLQTYTGLFKTKGGDTDAYTEMIYNKPWNRMAPYFIGILIGYILHYKGTKMHLKPSLNMLGWLTSVSILSVVILGTQDPFTETTMTQIQYVIYGSLARPAWALAIGWIIFACITGNGGIVNTFLSWKALVPLSRVSFSAYLVHILVVHYFYYSRMDNLYIDYYGMVVTIIGLVVLTKFCALLLSLLAEAPFFELEKIFWRKMAQYLQHPAMHSSKLDRNSIVAKMK